MPYVSGKKHWTKRPENRQKLIDAAAARKARKTNPTPNSITGMEFFPKAIQILLGELSGNVAPRTEKDWYAHIAHGFLHELEQIGG